MPSNFPDEPFHIPDVTPIAARVATLDELATEGIRDPDVGSLAGQVASRAAALATTVPASARRGAWMDRLLALEALRAIQSLPYKPDPAGEEWFQSARYTLRNGGDCEDLAVALVALMRSLGLQAAAVWITQPGQALNHVTAKVLLDGRWLWADPSVRSAMVGESPYDALQRTGAWHIVGGRPANLPATPAGAPKGGGGGGGWHGGGGGGWHGGGFRGGVRGFGVYPFGWSGWSSLWPGWPAWWWCNYYPYLCQSYSNLVATPTAYGYYSAPYAYLPFARYAAPVVGYQQRVALP